MFRLAVMCAHAGSTATVSSSQGKKKVTSAPFVQRDVQHHVMCNTMQITNKTLNGFPI